MAGNDLKSLVFIITAMLGAMVFTLMMVYLLFILGFSLTDFYITMENIGYFFVFAFVMAFFIAGLFYYFAVERRVGAWKMGRE